jgi:hypothetical protein
MSIMIFSWYVGEAAARKTHKDTNFLTMVGDMNG